MAAQEGCPLSRGWEKRIAAKTAAAGDRAAMHLAWHASTHGAILICIWRFLADRWDSHHLLHRQSGLRIASLCLRNSFIDVKQSAIEPYLYLRLHAVGMPT